MDNDTVDAVRYDVHVGRRLVTAPTVPVLKRTPHQSNQGVFTVLTNSWPLQCLCCGDRGHSTFNCPCLTVSHLISFAHHYSLHKIQQSPVMEKRYKQMRLSMMTSPRTPDFVRLLLLADRHGNNSRAGVTR